MKVSTLGALLLLRQLDLSEENVRDQITASLTGFVERAEGAERSEAEALLRLIA